MEVVRQGGPAKPLFTTAAEHAAMTATQLPCRIVFSSDRQAVRCRSEFDLAAELDDAVHRDAEELGGVEGEIAQQHKQLFER